MIIDFLLSFNIKAEIAIYPQTQFEEFRFFYSKFAEVKSRN